MELRETYGEHLETLDRQLADCLERAGRRGLPLEGVLFHAGRARTYHADDEEIPFRPTAHFRRWVPPLDGPDHLVLARPGATPRVLRVEPRDYWFDTGPPRPSYWEDAVDLEGIIAFEDAPAVLGPLEDVAYVGSDPEVAADLGIAAALVEPEALLQPLDWYRAYKTDHEVALVRRAVERTAAGHRGAREVFAAGGSEREIHWAYLESSGQLEREIPYNTIVALDEKGAILHYQHKRGSDEAPGRVLLLDAGGGWEGYAADVTRTWTTSEADPLFAELVRGLDLIERALVEMVTPGRPYAEIHLETHRLLAELLAESGLLRATPEEGLERGVTRAFMPHGVGHHLGLQVHDVGGHQVDPEGTVAEPPEAHPHLRTTRTLEAGHLVTIEPGIYFIPLLLDPLREGDESSLVDWSLVERLAGHGGARIEDDVLCTPQGARDLTRSSIPGPRESGG